MSVSQPVIDHLDTATKRIYLAAGVTEYHPVTDIYTEVRYMRRINEELRKYDMPVSAGGNIPKGGGKFTPRYAVLNHGWRIVPWDSTHALYVSGEQITDDGLSGPDCMDTAPLSLGTNVTIHYEPPASELVRADEEIAALKASAYNGQVVVDVINGVAGTEYPTGTHKQPSNNIGDAIAVGAIYGNEIMDLHGALTIPTGTDISGLRIVGENGIASKLTIESGVTVTGVQIDNLDMRDSDINGYVYINHTLAHNISNFAGFMEGCMLSGIISLYPNNDLGSKYIVDCKSGCVGLGDSDLPKIDLAGVSQHVAIRNWAGPVKLINSTDADNTVCIDVTSGATVIVDSTCTAGTIYLRGSAEVINNGTATVIKAALIDTQAIAVAQQSIASIMSDGALTEAQKAHLEEI